MTTYPQGIHVHRFHVNWSLIAIVGLAAAFIGLGSWWLVDRYAGGGGATHEATTLIDKWNAASSAHDASGLTALMTPSTVIWTNGTKIVGSKAIRSEIMGTPGLTAERIARVTVNGNYASTFVRFAVPAAGVDGPTTILYQFKDGKLLRMWQFVPGLTPPLDNAVTP